jgi:hypothetical protein
MLVSKRKVSTKPRAHRCRENQPSSGVKLRRSANRPGGAAFYSLQLQGGRIPRMKIALDLGVNVAADIIYDTALFAFLYAKRHWILRQ